MDKKIFFSYVIFFQFLFSICGKTSLSADSTYIIQPPEKWVEVVLSEKPFSTSETEISNGVYDSLLDYQTKIDENTITYFYHVTREIVNHEGIENAANIEVVFNPLKNKVILHSVKIHRGDQSFNQLLPRNIKVLQREKKLERQLYTGQKSLHIFLEDVRVGDIIDYSYSITDTYTTLHNRFFYNIYLSHYFPVYELRERLLWPKKLNISIRNHSTKMKPQIKENGDYTEYRWQIKNRPVIERKEGIPDGFDPFSWVEVREKKTWQEIALEEAKLYEVPQTLSQELRQYIKNLSIKNQPPSEQVTTVMRFVQDDLRYMGIASLDKSAPKDPSMVFQRRFGDCKDKTLLALTILRNLGIESYPAYVDTERKDLTTLLPSSNVFDHVIIVVRIGEKQYWLDPTHPFQRGSLENLVQSDFGHALILDSKTRTLTKMPPLTFSSNSRTVYEIFDLRHENTKPAIFTIKTLLKGIAADSFRRSLQANTKSEFQKDYLNYYARLYPSIQNKENLTIHDNEDLNQIEIKETYEIPTAWVQKEPTKRLMFEFFVEEIRSYLKSKHALPRSEPFAISYPVHITKQIKFLLPDQEWNFQPETLEIQDSAFIANPT